MKNRKKLLLVALALGLVVVGAKKLAGQPMPDEKA